MRVNCSFVQTASSALLYFPWNWHLQFCIKYGIIRSFKSSANLWKKRKPKEKNKENQFFKYSISRFFLSFIFWIFSQSLPQHPHTVFDQTKICCCKSLFALRVFSSCFVKFILSCIKAEFFSSTSVKLWDISTQAFQFLTHFSKNSVPLSGSWFRN